MKIRSKKKVIQSVHFNRQNPGSVFARNRGNQGTYLQVLCSDKVAFQPLTANHR